jgi:hypothetical protein
MKKLLLIGALALASSGAFAQSNQGQGANMGSDRNPAAAAPKSDTSTGMHQGATTGTGTSKTGSANGAPNAPAKTTTGPQGGPASDAESPPK